MILNKFWIAEMLGVLTLYFGSWDIKYEQTFFLKYDVVWESVIFFANNIAFAPVIDDFFCP